MDFLKITILRITIYKGIEERLNKVLVQLSHRKTKFRFRARFTTILFFSLQFTFFHWIHAQELSELLEHAYLNHPGLLAIQKKVEAEEFLIRSRVAFDDPTIGISTLDRGMKTHYGTVKQKIRFPLKYYLQGKIQKKKVSSLRSQVEIEKLSVRAQVIALYYSIYSLQKMIQLVQINVQTVKEFARVAEKKYAAGKSTQGDSMKAHFELTQLEVDLIRLNQEEEALQQELKAVLSDRDFKRLKLHKKKLLIPNFDRKKISGSLSKLQSSLTQNSPKIRKEFYLLEAAKTERALSQWEFVPDFHLQYQQRIMGEPEQSKIYSIGITIPLWFLKKRSKVSAALSYEMEQKYRVQHMIQKLIAAVKGLESKVHSGLKILKIYETSFIPQAQGAYRSTRAAYQAHKTSFLDLLDSERSLYRVKTGFYNSLRAYIKHITQLESYLGFRISNFNEKTEVFQ